MRAHLALLFAVLFVPGALAASFGAGETTWTQYDAPGDLPNADNAGEPTIGIPWATDHVFFQAYASTYKIVFDNGTAVWEDVTPPNGLPVNLDPMLHADPTTGRVWAGGLYTACSIMFYTDDEGASWRPSGNMCGLYAVDHQSIGSGPYAVPALDAVYPRVTYYCAQGQVVAGGAVDPIFGVASPTACATSLDGGVTWGPPVPWTGGCGSLHGHIRVSEVTGSAVVPDAGCSGGGAGFAFSDTNGAFWTSKEVAGSTAATEGFDPSIGFGHDEGWLWYGLANADGAHIALSKDEGDTWEPLGGGHGLNTTWLDVGQLHDPPIVRAAFSDVQAGDDDRVAFAFLGLEDTDGDGKGDEFPDIHQCDTAQETEIWHYYIAMSYDAGQTWTVQRMTDDPVQVGGIWDGGGGDPCRNLLDFNDMDIDSQGRVYVGFADGCIEECATNPAPDSSGYRAAHGAVLRQETGRGLFAAYDVQDNGTVVPSGPDAGGAGDNDSPGLGVLALMGAFAAVAAVLRRRR